MNLFEAITLDQLDDTAKTGSHIGLQRLELISDAIVEEVYDPTHPFTIIAFLQCRSENSAEQRKRWSADR